VNSKKIGKILKITVPAVLVLLILSQFIPVSRDDPPVTREVQWNSAQTRELAQGACFDCHSNETVWPWYSYVAPVSWWIAGHVHDGRRRLNFSEWDQPNEGERDIIDAISSGEMPLSPYPLMHPKAKLTEAQKQTLIDGLKQTLANDPPIERQRPSR
jgi:mono/diheme cytochrome c family protein